MTIHDIGDFSFLGFSIMKNGKLGHFKISNDNNPNEKAVPAIYRNPNLAIKEFNKNNDGEIVKVEVFKDGSLIILSKTDQVISKREFKITNLMSNLNINVPEGWVEIVAKIGNRTLACSSKTFY